MPLGNRKVESDRDQTRRHRMSVEDLPLMRSDSITHANATEGRREQREHRGVDRLCLAGPPRFGSAICAMTYHESGSSVWRSLTGSEVVRNIGRGTGCRLLWNRGRIALSGFGERRKDR